MFIDGPQVVRDTEVEAEDGKHRVLGAGLDVYLSNVLFFNYDDENGEKMEKERRGSARGE